MTFPALGGPAVTGSHPAFRSPKLHWLKGWLLPVAILIAWDILARRHVGSGFAFVTLDQLYRAFVDTLSSGQLGSNVGVSLGRVAIGLIVGGGLGVAIGAAMASSPVVDRVIGPVFHAIRQVPTLGWIPLLGLWFGYGELPKVLIICKAAMFPLVLNTYEGLKGVKQDHLDVGRVLTLDPLSLFFRVRLPGALPMILTGLQQALAFSWIACIGVEILFGSGPGIGAMIEEGQIQGRMDVVLLGVIFVGLIAYAITTLFTRLAARQLRWRELKDQTS
jgi:sulfonate transport system permease protein